MCLDYTISKNFNSRIWKLIWKVITKIYVTSYGIAGSLFSSASTKQFSQIVIQDYIRSSDLWMFIRVMNKYEFLKKGFHEQKLPPAVDICLLSAQLLSS
jgi:hypothetical protein